VVRNLSVYNNKVIKKLTIHKLINLLKKELNFTIKNLEISFVNSSKIVQVNSKHLHHNYSTDIITFNYSKPKSSLEGEILISLDDALENSKRFHTSFREELIRLVIHGILHLIGYKDEKLSEKKVMKTKENSLLRKYKFLFE
jgi:probable rRNA maturation factor